MFGCVVAGRLVQTDLHQIDSTHFVFPLQSAASINHICVFLLGTVPFPADVAATVHLIWPSRGMPDQLLGMLGNEKPSAIFRIRPISAPSSNAAPAFASTMMEYNADVAADSAFLGLVIEPLWEAAAQVANLPAPQPPNAPNAQDAIALADRIVKNLFNYLSSFSPNPAAPLTADTAVPIGLITKWSESFMTKLKNGGLAFLSRGD